MPPLRTRRLRLFALAVALAQAPAFGGVVETVEPAFRPGVLLALDVQTLALQPSLGRPDLMAQTLLTQASGSDQVTAAVLLKRALSEPAAYAAVQSGLAAQPGATAAAVTSRLAAANDSIRGLPRAQEAFVKTFAPLERALGSQDSYQPAAAALDAFFSGQKSAGGLSDPNAGVFAAGAASTPKTAAPLQKAGPHRRLDAILARPDMKPEDLLQELKLDPFLRAQYARKVGLDEGYTLERHTLMVLGQFEKYFSSGRFTEEERAFMRLLLAFHDIGKPAALEKHNLRLQHQLSGEIVARSFPKLGVSAARTRLAVALLDGDPLGRFFKLSDAEEAVYKIAAMAKDSGVPAAAFYRFLEAYYMADASSYTADAGGKYSLDYLFRFDRARRRMEFDPDAARRLKAVSDRFAGR